MTDPADPWSVPIAVEKIPETGLHRDIEADRAARNAMAEAAGLREILSASASIDVTPDSGGRFHVLGRVLAPPEQIPALADLVDDGDESEADIPDPPEPIENGMIDLGRLATDALFLAIDPYPRKPDAVFEPLVAAADPEDHPFAALKALQVDPKAPGGKKPKKR